MIPLSQGVDDAPNPAHINGDTHMAPTKLLHLPTGPAWKTGAAVAAFTAYVACVLAANIVTDHLQTVPVGFGQEATAGTYAAGLALLSRDLLQDTAGRRVVVAAIAVGAALSWWLSTPQLAAASGVAFLVAESADMAVYTPLRNRGRWVWAVTVSNTVGALVDTFLFLWLAGFPVWMFAPGQLIGKVLWATAVPVTVIAAARWVWHSKAVTAWNS